MKPCSGATSKFCTSNVSKTDIFIRIDYFQCWVYKWEMNLWMRFRATDTFQTLFYHCWHDWTHWQWIIAFIIVLIVRNLPRPNDCPCSVHWAKHLECELNYHNIYQFVCTENRKWKKQMRNNQRWKRTEWLLAEPSCHIKQWAFYLALITKCTDR